MRRTEEREKLPKWHDTHRIREQFHSLAGDKLIINSAGEFKVSEIMAGELVRLAGATYCTGDRRVVQTLPAVGSIKFLMLVSETNALSDRSFG